MLFQDLLHGKTTCYRLTCSFELIYHYLKWKMTQFNLYNKTNYIRIVLFCTLAPPKLHGVGVCNQLSKRFLISTHTTHYARACSLYEQFLRQDKEQMAGKTGQQRMLTHPRHLLLPLSFWGLCCCALNLYFF